MNFETIFKNNERWIQEQLTTSPSYFEQLSSGQQPEILYIGCSDSRVTAESMMGAQPGEVFVHRNIANLAPNNDLNVLSVINYAVVHLKVQHIVVCGHYGCGGIKAAMTQQDLGLLNPWLRNIRDVYRLHKEVLNAITDEEARYKRLVELNVVEQCINVTKTIEVQRAIKERKLQVHGWVFDIHTGKIIPQKIDVPEIIQAISSIYKLTDEHQ